eukprot:4682003-Amphidinium_carterae.1
MLSVRNGYPSMVRDALSAPSLSIAMMISGGNRAAIHSSLGLVRFHPSYPLKAHNDLLTMQQGKMIFSLKVVVPSFGMSSRGLKGLSGFDNGR